MDRPLNCASFGVSATFITRNITSFKDILEAAIYLVMVENPNKRAFFIALKTLFIPKSANSFSYLGKSRMRSGPAAAASISFSSDLSFTKLMRLSSVRRMLLAP
jgi:hypothetical protein